MNNELINKLTALSAQIAKVGQPKYQIGQVVFNTYGEPGVIISIEFNPDFGDFAYSIYFREGEMEEECPQCLAAEEIKSAL